MRNGATGHIWNKLARLGRSGLEGLNHLLWPGVCDCCGCPIDEGRGGLCQECSGELLECTAGEYCRRCGRDVSRYAIIEGRCGHCQGIELFFDGLSRGGVYSGSLRKMILSLKFQDHSELGDRLGGLVDSALAGSGFAGEVDYFVPVPLHWRRKLVRGYNQSLLICRGLKDKSVPVNTDLVRIRYTQRQWNLSPAGRRRNVKDAFAVRKGHVFSGKTVCLVDDITTSGATLNECARTLKRYGAKKVYGLVAAAAMQLTD